MRYLLKGIFNVAIGEDDKDGNDPPRREPDAAGKAKLEACASLSRAKAEAWKALTAAQRKTLCRREGRMQGAHRSRRQGRAVIQGSPEWFAARCGNATASEFACVLAKGEGKTRAKYLRRVVAERLTGKPCETFSNCHTDRGTLQEPMRGAGVRSRNRKPRGEVGFIKHPSSRPAAPLTA
jgi:hypothetical protein